MVGWTRIGIGMGSWTLRMCRLPSSVRSTLGTAWRAASANWKMLSSFTWSSRASAICGSSNWPPSGRGSIAFSVRLTVTTTPDSGPIDSNHWSRSIPWPRVIMTNWLNPATMGSCPESRMAFLTQAQRGAARNAPCVAKTASSGTMSSSLNLPLSPTDVSQKMPCGGPGRWWTTADRLWYMPLPSGTELMPKPRTALSPESLTKPRMKWKASLAAVCSSPSVAATMASPSLPAKASSFAAHCSVFMYA